MELKQQLETLRLEALSQIKASKDLNELNNYRIAYLGKKGPITEALRGLKNVAPEERPIIGGIANTVRDEIAQAIEAVKVVLEEQAINAKIEAETIDVTLPGKKMQIGTKHVLTQILEEIEDFFIGMGYQVVDGPEVELDSYNFEKMNLPKDHPARDMQDTFYITDEILMRTHTSPVQARTMEKHDFEKGPLKMISPGKVYRRDSDDATHSHQFTQIEGLVVAEKVTLSDLKGTLDIFAKKLFGEEREIRLRPSYFPFTEPSVEVDVSCFKCGGEGCNVCKGSGWIEILGSGQVHPDVLEMSGVDSNKYTGFAFGVGAERVAMLKYGIDDIRHFYQNDKRFLDQFTVKEQ